MASSSVTSDRPDLSAPAGDGTNDPFVSASSTASSHLRFSDFDQELFAAGPGSDPRQAKRALEAHLAETDRRLDEAGKLGTALVSQRKALAEQLQEVDKLQAEEELAPDLRKKLVDIEKDYNDLARESARVFLPKQRVTSNENPGSPFMLDSRSGRVRSNSIPISSYFPFHFRIMSKACSITVMYILHYYTHISYIA
jgi:hypothetical protein